MLEAPEHVHMYIRGQPVHWWLCVRAGTTAVETGSYIQYTRKKDRQSDGGREESVGDFLQKVKVTNSTWLAGEEKTSSTTVNSSTTTTVSERVCTKEVSTT